MGTHWCQNASAAAKAGGLRGLGLWLMPSDWSIRALRFANAKAVANPKAETQQTQGLPESNGGVSVASLIHLLTSRGADGSSSSRSSSSVSSGGGRSSGSGMDDTLKRVASAMGVSAGLTSTDGTSSSSRLAPLPVGSAWGGGDDDAKADVDYTEWHLFLTQLLIAAHVAT